MGKKKASPKRRSGCPLNASVEILNDPWSLPIIRDMMLRGFRTCKEFLERIATNILADRLRKFEAHGITTTDRDRSVERKLICLLTAKGIDLGPLLTQMVLWADAHKDRGNQAMVQLIQQDQQQFLAAVPPRWAEKPSRSTTN